MRTVLRFTFAAVALTLACTAAAQAPIEPAEGFWYDPERSGSGFSLERRGDVVALTAYDFADHLGATAANRWRLASAPLVGDTVVATLQSYANGSCFGCEDFTAAELQPGESTLRLTFDSARSATLQIDELPPRRVVTVPYGSTYLDASFAPADVPLPDLAGTWVYAQLGSGNWSAVLKIGPAEYADGAVGYFGSATGSGGAMLMAECATFELGEAPSCRVWLFDDLVQGPPPWEIGRLLLGDIAEDRMTGVDQSGVSVVFHRLGNAEPQP